MVRFPLIVRIVCTMAIAALVASVPSLAKPPAAGQILRKAESVRNPDLDYAVDFAIHGVAKGTRLAERDASYSMLASGKDRTVILMRSPEMLYGALVMIVDGKYWMLLPKASKTWELSGAQMQNGDVATGDLARVNLTKGYTATMSGEEAIEGAACFRLELQAADPAGRHARILYWVAKDGLLPKRLDFYGRTGGLVKTLRYFDYRKGALGLRPMRLTIESFDEWKESSTLTFTNLRKIAPPRGSFTPEGMTLLRDAAIAAHETEGAIDVPLERILRLSGSSPMR